MDTTPLPILTFVAVLREGSFSAAARHLGISQSTASRHIAALEQDLGGLLFERRGGKALPTLAAERLADAAGGVEEALGSFRRRLIRGAGGDREVVRVTSSPELVSRLLAPRVRVLLRAAPDLRVSLSGTSELERLTGAEADVALRVVAPVEASLVRRRVARIRYRLYGTRSALRARSRHYIGYAPPFDRLPEAQWLEENVAPGSIRFWTSPPSAVLAACVAGIGLALLPDPLAASARRLLPASQPALERPLYVVYHRELSRAPRIRAVVDWLVACVGELESPD